MFWFALGGPIVYGLLFTMMQQVIGHHFRVQPAKHREAPARLVLLAAFAPTMIFAAISTQHQRPHLTQVVLGTALVVAGLALSTWSQIALGRYWIPGVGLHKGHKLIMTGPYKYVRHPMYSGMILSMVGFALAVWNVWYALSMVFWIGGFIFRIFGEEHLLRRKFPKQYAAYTANTGMLVPRLPWRL